MPWAVRKCFSASDGVLRFSWHSGHFTSFRSRRLDRLSASSSLSSSALSLHESCNKFHQFLTLYFQFECEQTISSRNLSPTLNSSKIDSNFFFESSSLCNCSTLFFKMALAFLHVEWSTSRCESNSDFDGNSKKHRQHAKSFVMCWRKWANSVFACLN